jgi:hypothetical protein
MTNYVGFLILICSVFSLTLCTHDDEATKKYRLENVLQENEVKVGFSLSEYEKIYKTFLPTLPNSDPIFVSLIGGSLKININGDEAISQIRNELLKLQNIAQISSITIKKAKSVSNPSKGSVYLVFELSGETFVGIKDLQKKLSKHSSITSSIEKVKIPIIEVAIDPMMDPESLENLIAKANKIIDQTEEIDRTFIIEWDVQ